jgi:hypothetical protein
MHRSPQLCGRSHAALALARFFSMVGLIALASAAPAQDRSSERSWNEFGIWGSASVNSPDVYGSRAHGDFAALGFRYGRIISVSRRRVIEYTIDVLPAEAMHQPTYTACIYTGRNVVSYCANGHETIYGGGIAPLGWKFNFLPRRRFQPFAALSGGWITTTQRIPTDVPGGALFNFTAEWQLGFERFDSSRKRAWILGYKLEHISDAFRTRLNPGVDLNVLFFGYSFFR